MYKPIKPKNKIFRVIFQLAVILAAIGWIVSIAMERGYPREQHKDEWMQRRGFLALSYGAISRRGDGPNLSREMLGRHLDALTAAGYETITVDDIVNFYKSGQLLPDKAIFILFEGGRRDSAVFGQEVLMRTGMRATMFVYTGLLRSWERTFLTRSQLSALGRSRFWDVGSLGHEIYLPGHDSEEKRGVFFLADYMPGETPEEFRARATEDYDQSDAILEKIIRRQPESRIFMPANTLGGSMDPFLRDINRGLMAARYKIAFTREGVAFNQLSDDPQDLSRLRIPPDCGVEELFNRITLWLPSSDPYVYSAAGANEQWLREYGAVEYQPDALRLESSEGEPAMVWLLGSEGWRNLAASVTLRPSDAEQSLYLRFASRQSFVKVTVGKGKIRIYERVPEYGLTRLLEKDIPNKEEIVLSVLLRNNRLGVKIDGRGVTDYLIPLTVETPGRFALETVNADGDSVSAFGELSAQPIPPRWAFANGTVPDLNVSGFLFESGKADTKRLLDIANMGFDRYRVLPKGVYDLKAMESGLDDVPGDIGRRLWTGVILTPDVGGNETWHRLSQAVMDAKRFGRKAAIRLNRALAEELTTIDPPPPADMLVIDDNGVGGELSRKVKAALYRKYHAILFGENGSYEEKAP